MSVETDRETLIREGDEEVVRQEEKRRRQKLRSLLPDILDQLTLVEEVIESYIKAYGHKHETKQETMSGQLEVTEDKDDREPFHLKSKIGIAKSGSLSLRATIPEGIAVFLDLKAGDKLEWKMDVVDGKRIVIVKKLTEEKK